MNQTPIFAADDLIVIGASTGGVEALRVVVGGLPSHFPAAVLVVMHVGQHNSLLPSLLASVTPLPVRHARDGEVLEPGRVLVGPPDVHLTVERNGAVRRVALARGPKENHARPAIDPLFRTAAAAYGERAVGVILTGFLDDGTAGLYAIKACGGKAVVQWPDEAAARSMPDNALEAVDVDRVLRLAEIGPALARMVEENQTEARHTDVRVPGWVQVENGFTRGEGDMETLSRIGTPSTYTCPECHGTLWQMTDAGPKRFRCHTGHAYTEKHLCEQQGELVEDSLWSAVRALQEKESLLRQMAEEALAAGHAQAAVVLTDRAAEARRSAEVLRKLMTATRQHEPVQQDE